MIKISRRLLLLDLLGLLILLSVELSHVLIGAGKALLVKAAVNSCRRRVKHCLFYTTLYFYTSSFGLHCELLKLSVAFFIIEMSTNIIWMTYISSTPTYTYLCSQRNIFYFIKDKGTPYWNHARALKWTTAKYCFGVFQKNIFIIISTTIHWINLEIVLKRWLSNFMDTNCYSIIATSMFVLHLSWQQVVQVYKFFIFFRIYIVLISFFVACRCTTNSNSQCKVIHFRARKT